MPKTVLQGSISHKARSLAVLTHITAGVLLRRAINKPLVPEWSAMFEIGTLFWRHQFNHAFALGDIKVGRTYMDSCYSVLDPDLAVDVVPSEQPNGHWLIPRTRKRDETMLYFHGGGYAFYLDVSRHFIALLAQTLGISIFAPDYRLTPEHPHPAQIEDGLAAYRYLLGQGHDPERLVVCGDSAGGHLVLMLLLKLRAERLTQPALAIGLSPWTDIGRRGESQFGNDRYDMVQGYQTLQFGEWLKGDTGLSDAELSPIHHDFRGLAPIYLQAGGKEILVDMIRDFARTLEGQGAQVRLDVWEHMTHEFHAYGDHLPESRVALEFIGEAIAWAAQVEGTPAFPGGPQTEVDGFRA